MQNRPARFDGVEGRRDAAVAVRRLDENAIQFLRPRGDLPHDRDVLVHLLEGREHDHILFWFRSRLEAVLHDRLEARAREAAPEERDDCALHHMLHHRLGSM